MAEAVATGDPAAALARAWLEGTTIPDPAGWGELSLGQAYEVQDALVAKLAEAGREPTGYKAGATSSQALALLNLSAPIFGRVYGPGAEDAGDRRLSCETLNSPRGEPEIALVLGEDIDRPDRDHVLAAIASVHVAIELADTRIADWAGGPMDLVADCAGAGTYALGPANPVDRFAGGLDDLFVEFVVNDQHRGAGRGADVVSGVLGIATEIAAWCASGGRPLRAGTVILTGSLTSPVEVQAGSVLWASSEQLGEVRVVVE